jgi:glycosyltransferase involved in cell wall biosynthesis
MTARASAHAAAVAAAADPPPLHSRRGIAVVIPCYKVRDRVLPVIERIPRLVESIHVVDDGCPEQTGAFVQTHCRDPRVRVLVHQENRGVGGAMVTGYRDALAAGATVVVKIDGDGQMDPGVLDRLVSPILNGRADYTKGNRFFDIELLKEMPRRRVFGNAVLSIVNKICSGYWNIADPTNGYTAIHASVLALLPLDKVDRRFFFESDMLFRLNVMRAVVADVPLAAHYADEVSNLSVTWTSLEFPGKYLARFVKRIFYSYFLRDFSAGTMALVLGSALTIAGGTFGAWRWYLGALTGRPATSGEVMLSGLPVLVGCQLLISAVNFDIANVPVVPLHRSLASTDLALGPHP